MENNLKKLRLEKKLFQKDVAEKCNINRSTYNQYEQGKVEMDHETLKKLSKFYNVSIDYILNNETDEEITDFFCHVLPQNAVDFWDEKGEFVRFKLSSEDWQTAFKMLESLAIDKAGKKYWNKD